MKNYLECCREVRALLLTLDAKNPGIFQHCERVSVYAVAIGDQLGVSIQDLKKLRLTALLHHNYESDYCQVFNQQIRKLNLILNQSKKRYDEYTENIPLTSRIIAVSHSYDYNHFYLGQDRKQSWKNVKRFSGTLFDPKVIHALESVLPKIYMVQLDP